MYIYIQFYSNHRLVRIKIENMSTKAPKAFEKKYTIWDIVRFFHIGLKIFGFANFSIDGNISNGKIKLNLFDITWFFMTNAITCCLIYLNWNTNLALIATSSRVINVGSRAVIIYQVTNVLFTSILMFLRRNEVRKTLINFFL